MIMAARRGVVARGRALGALAATLLALLPLAFLPAAAGAQPSTTTTLSLSSPSVAYGDESTVTFTATVTSGSSGTPTGTVTVATGPTTLCTITLPATTCAMDATTLDASPGAYPVVATYGGDQNFAGSSSSPPQDLVVDQGTASRPFITNIPAGATEGGSFVASVATDGDGPATVASSTTAVCTVGGDGLTVSFVTAGTCTLTAQVGTGTNYLGASGSPQTFTVLPAPRGYWLVGSDGGIFSFGAASFHGSMGGVPLQRPVVGITPTADRQGYWLVASDGGIFSFGDSSFYGSLPALGLNPAGSGGPHSLSAPIVGMVPSSTGHGYFMVGSDGGVFAFGDARFAGSCPGIGGCAGAAVAVMPDHSGNGYWLVTTTGAVYAFGDAPFFGTPPAQPDAVVDAVAAPNGQGYWILFANGAVFAFGSAPSDGAPVGYVNTYNPATAIFPTSDGLGYWVVAAHGDVFSYGDAPFLGGMAATPLNGPIIAGFGF
jgi:Bacterial Ig-like domain (group 3)